MTEHVATVQPAVKMDTPVGLYRWVCSCGRYGGADSERGARVGGRQHVADKTGQAPPNETER